MEEGNCDYFESTSHGFTWCGQKPLTIDNARAHSPLIGFKSRPLPEQCFNRLNQYTWDIYLIVPLPLHFATAVYSQHCDRVSSFAYIGSVYISAATFDILCLHWFSAQSHKLTIEIPSDVFFFDRDICYVTCAY